MKEMYKQFYNKKTSKVLVPLNSKKGDLFKMEVINGRADMYDYVEYDFVELEGTEKQVAWADDIRYEIVIKIQAKVEEILEEVEDEVKEGDLEHEYSKKQLKRLLGTEEDDLDFLVEYAKKLVPFVLTNFREASSYIDNRACLSSLFGTPTYGHPMAPKKWVFNTKTIFEKMLEK